MTHYLDQKTAPHSYRVNVLNKSGKEVWRYFRTVESARSAQSKAQALGIDSGIYQKKNGNYKAL